MISREDIDTVKSRADIADVISRLGVTLKTAGVGAMKGLCPFHDEKSPSFTVRPGPGTYKCFGCGAGGDVFSFLSLKEGLSFSDAVHYVADMYNLQIVDIGDEEQETGPSKRHLLDALQKAAKFFMEAYSVLPDTHPAKVELSKRKLSEYSKETGVGYAPEGWSHLVDHLKKEGFTEEDLLVAGLASKSENGRIFDFFRGRLIWQIRDITGRVIGFGARKLFDSDNGGKYLNSQQSPVYDKSRVLYGIDMARAEAAKTRSIIIVEGYTDVMALRAVGITNVVATCGTAFSDGHAGVVRRLVGDGGKIVFAFDGDAAGRKAARHTFSISTPIHMVSSVVMFKDGDPDELRRDKGDQALRDAMAITVPLTEYVLRDELSRHDTTTPEGRAAFLSEAAPLLSKISDMSLREDYIRKVTLWSGSTLDVVRSQMNSGGKPVPDNKENTRNKSNVPVDPALLSRQKSILSICLQRPEIAKHSIKKLEPDFFDDELQPTATEIIICLQGLGFDVSKMSPDEFDDPELASELINHRFPLADRMENDKEQEDYFTRTLPSLIKSVKALRRKDLANALRASISASYGDKSSNDVDVLKDIVEKQRALR